MFIRGFNQTLINVWILSVPVFDAAVFARLSDQSRRSGGPESREPVPHLLSGDDDFVDIRRMFNEQVGASQNSSCSTEQQAAVYHLWKTQFKQTS